MNLIVEQKRKKLGDERKKTRAEKMADLEREEKEEQDRRKKFGGGYYRDVDFADDPTQYTQRVPREERLKFWEALTDLNIQKPVIPEGEMTWVEENRTNIFENELKKYPSYLYYLLCFCTSIYWDYVFIFVCGAWFILISLYLDKGEKKLIISIGQNILLYPLGIMFLSQIIPVLGCCYFIPRCNDLSRLLARESLGSWVRSISYFKYIYKLISII